MEGTSVATGRTGAGARPSRATTAGAVPAARAAEAVESAAVETAVDPVVAAAEAAEFAAFVERHGGGLFRAVRRRVASVDDAQDVVQEALLRTWRRRHDHADDTHRRNFAHLVADRLVIDLHRSKEHQVEARATFADDVLGSAPSPADLYVRAEDRARVTAALRALPADQRALLVDAELSELSLDELRQRYDATAEVLRYRRFRARRALRRQLERGGAPALVPVLLRRVPVSWRNLWHRLQDVSWAPAGAHAAVVVLTTISMVAGPFNGAVGPVRDAVAGAPPVTNATAGAATARAARQPASTGTTATRAVTPGRTVSATGAVAGGAVLESRGSTRRTGPAPATPHPSVCVGDTCVSGDGDDADVDVLVIDAPVVREHPIKQDAVPVCKHLPSQKVTACHTEGDPTYTVPLSPLPGTG